MAPPDWKFTVTFTASAAVASGSCPVESGHPVYTKKEEQLLEYAALAECHSTHPISISLQKAYGKKLDVDRVTDVQEIGGHGVGVEIHESPYASPSREDILPENSIVTVEPGIYLEGKFGVRIEDFVVVTENGCINMTKAPKELICL